MSSSTHSRSLYLTWYSCNKTGTAASGVLHASKSNAEPYIAVVKAPVKNGIQALRTIELEVCTEAYQYPYHVMNVYMQTQPIKFNQR